jgi:hypothetical protein
LLPLSLAYGTEQIQQMRKLRQEFFEKEKTNVEAMGTSINRIPTHIDLEGKHQLQVSVTGLSGLDLESALGQYMSRKIAEALKRVIPLDARLESGTINNIA